MKTPAQNFGNDRISDMEVFDKMSRRIQWFQNEFSHSLSPEPTDVSSSRSLRAKADGSVSSSIAVHAAGRRWLSFFR